MAVGDKIFVADKDTLDEVNTKCGTILTNTNNLNTRLTATRAGYLDYLANSTYGLNAIKNAINTVDTNVDSIKTYTTTNNTASKTGILSQKSTYIINMLENSTYGLNAIKSSIGGISDSGTGTTIITVQGNYNTTMQKNDYCYICKFIAPKVGLYQISVSFEYVAGGNEFIFYKFYGGQGNIKDQYQELIDGLTQILPSTVYEVNTQAWSDAQVPNFLRISDYRTMGAPICDIHTAFDSSPVTALFQCYAGEPVVIYCLCNRMSSSDSRVRINSVTITCS